MAPPRRRCTEPCNIGAGKAGGLGHRELRVQRVGIGAQAVNQRRLGQGGQVAACIRRTLGPAGGGGGAASPLPNPPSPRQKVVWSSVASSVPLALSMTLRFQDDECTPCRGSLVDHGFDGAGAADHRSRNRNRPVQAQRLFAAKRFSPNRYRSPDPSSRSRDNRAPPAWWARRGGSFHRRSAVAPRPSGRGRSPRPARKECCPSRCRSAPHRGRASFLSLS